jgi:hypothetical protein
VLQDALHHAAAKGVLAEADQVAAEGVQQVGDVLSRHALNDLQPAAATSMSEIKTRPHSKAHDGATAGAAHHICIAAEGVQQVGNVLSGHALDNL